MPTMFNEKLSDDYDNGPLPHSDGVQTTNYFKIG